MDDEERTRDPETHKAWAKSMQFASWREKTGWAQTIGRNVDRIADGLRPALVDYATGHGEANEVLAKVRGLRWQLAFIEGRVRALEETKATDGISPWGNEKPPE